MKTVSIVSAVGHYENTVKYLETVRADDENYLIIFMYNNSVVVEKILTQTSSRFWKKIYIFEPQQKTTSGMNSVKLNETVRDFKKFLKDVKLEVVDEVYLGVLPLLPMYNFIPSCFGSDVKINSIEDGTASYMLNDEKMFQYMTAPSLNVMKKNKQFIKKKVNRKENGLMLLNIWSFVLFNNKWLERIQYQNKWARPLLLNKIILSEPEYYVQSDAIKYEQIEQFEFDTLLTTENVNFDEAGLPIYFDQSFGVPAAEHIKSLDKVFTERGYETVIIKLHPKSKPNYINAFYEQQTNTIFKINTQNISGEELLKEACPKTIIGFNSTVLFKAKKITNIDFIFSDYLKHISTAVIERNYYALMFMNHATYNLKKMLGQTATLYDLKCRKSVLLGIRQPEELETQSIDDSVSQYVVKLNRGVRAYMRRASKIEIEDKKIFFEAYMGMYACSPKEIYLYMKSLPEFADYTFVWSRSLNMDIDSQVELANDERTIIVNYGSQDYFDQLAAAKIIFTNQRLHKKFERKEGQYIVQSWHGTPFKKDATSIEVSSHNVSNERRYEVNSHDVKNYNYFLVQNEFSAIELAKTFMLDDFPEVKLLKTGYPRNQRLVQQVTTEEIDNLKSKYNIPKDKKVMLYVPTWRDHHKKNKAGINDIFDFDLWQEQLSDEWVVLFRGHYFHSKSVDLEKYEGFIYDTSNFNDINDFYLIADLLVTDYSSAFFDYLNLQRPIIFYMPDFLAYIKLSRKLHFVPETDLPGPVSYVPEAFIADVKNWESVTAKYVQNYDQYINEFLPWDKNATETLINTLKEDEIL